MDADVRFDEAISDFQYTNNAYYVYSLVHDWYKQTHR